jgi:hypothetical protein
MTDPSSCENHPLSLSLARRINDVCNRFERAWQAGPRPRLEDFLADTPEPERSALLRELIALDIDYRRRASTTLAQARVGPLDRMAQANLRNLLRSDTRMARRSRKKRHTGETG